MQAYYPQIRQRLSLRLARQVLLFALLFGFLASALQIKMDCQQVKQEFRHTTQQFIDMMRMPATQAALTFDESLAAEIIEGLKLYQPVHRIQLVAGSDFSLAEYQRPEQNYQELSRLLIGCFQQQLHSYKLELFENPVWQQRQPMQVGYLLIEADIYSYAKQFQERALLTILTNLLFSFFIAIVILLLFQRLVAKPLSNIPQTLSATNPNSPQITQLDIFEDHKNDELGTLVVFTNQMLTTINQRIAREKQLNEELEQKVVERTAELHSANQEIQQLNENLKVENQRMGAELDIARRLQEMVLPKTDELTAIKDLDIAGCMEPATEVGGDYYDVLQHPEKPMVKIGIGDVTGHGLESGVLMIMVQTAVQTLLHSPVQDPRQFLNILNQAIYANIERMGIDKNLTLSFLDYQAGSLLISGQHEEVLKVDQEGQIERIDTLSLGFMLGIEPDISHLIAQQRIDLKAGEGVVLYTDGITESRSPTGEIYGIERLCQQIQQHWSLSVDTVREAIIKDVHQHIQGQQLLDDITLVGIRQRADYDA